MLLTCSHIVRVIKYAYMEYKARLTYHVFIAAAILIAAYIFAYSAIGQDVFSHSDYDSYTRQAAAWWHGSAQLPPPYETDAALKEFRAETWLEIAEYNGKHFVSFPPFPSVVQFMLYPMFGMGVPDNLVNTLFGLGSLILIYCFLIRRGFEGFSASAFALLMTLGSNLFYISVTGWVWFSAQTQSFFFSALAVYLIYSKNKGAWYFSFLALGIAVACRPFQLVYAPLMLYILYKNIGGEKGFVRNLLACVKYVVPMAAVGLLIAAYNYSRFGDIFEFGHNFLPEFAREEQFSFSYVPGNFLEVLKLPEIRGGRFEWPMFNGTLFFLVNPVFVALAVSLVRRFDIKQAIYLLCFLAHFVLLLTHRTMGGWQFGSRYLVDLLPFMLVVFADDRSYKTFGATKAAALPAALAVFGAALNIWGALWYYGQNI